MTVANSDHTELLRSLHVGIWRWQSVFPLPVSIFQAVPVTSSLDFDSFLLSLFAFFLILVLRFIRGNTCPPKDGLHAVTD